MKKRFRKTLIALCSLVTLACSSVLSAGLTKASADTFKASTGNVITVSDGLTVTHNVSGSEKVASLTKDVRGGIHFSSKQAGDGAEGNFVAFKNTLSGLFEMDFRVYTQNKGSITYGGGDWFAGNDAEEIREVAITLTDTDKNESFTLYIKGGSPYMQSIPNARVAYGDVNKNYGTGLRYGYEGNGQDYDDTTTPYNGGTLASKEYNTQLRGTSFTNSYLHSTAVGFDPITKEVYTYAFKSSGNEADYTSIFNRRVILDLDNAEHLKYAGEGAGELLKCKFNNYTVKFTLTDVTGAEETGSQGKDETANFIIYSLNGQSLASANGLFVSSTAPGLTANVDKAFLNEEYEIPTPVLQSVLGEKPSFTGKVQVLDANDNVVVANQTLSDGLSFTPTSVGTYKIIYSGVRDGGNNIRKSFTARGTYVGAEVTYTYPLEIKKLTAGVDGLFNADGLDVQYNVSGVDAHADLVSDTTKGMAFTSTAVGADAIGVSVAFNKTLTGLMELNFRAYTQTSDTSSDYWNGGDWHSRNNAEEIREMAITVTDTETNESFSVYIQGGTAWNAVTPNARVAYGEVGQYYGSGRWYKVNANGLAYYGTGKGLSSTEYNTELVGTSFTNRARNTGGFIGGGYSTNIGFDPTTKTVYAYTYGTGEYLLEKRPILDLDDAEDMQYLTMNSAGAGVGVGLPETFKNSTFKNYTVKMTVTDVTEDMSAKFIVYHLNGQSLSVEKEKLMSNAGYGLYLPEGEDRFVGLEDAFPAPYASAVLTGEKAFNGTIEIVDENGNVVLEKQTYSESVAFKPTVAGKYIAYYGGMADENDCVRLQYGLGTYDGEEERFAYAFNVQERAVELPAYDYVMKKMGVEVGAKPLGVGLETYLTVKKDGVVYNGAENVEVGANYSYFFQDNGEYELFYTVKNAYGSEVYYSTSLEVVAMTAFMKNPISVAQLGQDFILDTSDFTVYYCNEGVISDYVISAEIFNGESWVAVNAQPATSVNLKEVFLQIGAGERKVSFVLSKNGDSVRVEKTFSVGDFVAPTLTVETLSQNFVSTPEKDSQNIKNFVVLSGTVGTIPFATALDDIDGTVAVTVLIKAPEDETARESAFGDELLFSAGEYVIAYKAVDNAGNESSVFYMITVKDLWLGISAQMNTVELGSNVVFNAPAVINQFTGETLSDFNWNAKVYFGGTELEKTYGAYRPVYTGVYQLVYTVAYNGATQEYTLDFMVEDTVKPVIEVEGTYESTAKLGDTLKIYDVWIDDASTCGLTISVMYNDATRVQVNEYNKFVVDKAGKYVIKYSATDVAGNTTSVEYTITVEAETVAEEEQSGCSSSVGGSLAIVMLITVLGGALLLKRKENKNL